MAKAGEPEQNELRSLLAEVSSGSLSVDQALQRLGGALSQASGAAYEDLGYAKVDHDRARRTGFPEVIFGSGKTAQQICGIAAAINRRGDNVLVTRCSPEAAAALGEKLPGSEYFDVARIAFVRAAGNGAALTAAAEGAGTAAQSPKTKPASDSVDIAVVSAGTSDLPVAEEAAVSAELLGNSVDRIYDVGVAGIHRLLAQGQRLSRARAIIVVAGMEGALASVVTGLVAVPVIAVPTSVGYGANLGGVTALLAMLSSCASGMGVVNIDNGFGAAYLAATFTRQLGVGA